MLGSISARTSEASELREVTNSDNEDSVVLDQCSRSSKEHDATILISISIVSSVADFRAYRRVVDSVIPDVAILTAHANAICPLLEGVRSARPNIIVLNGDIIAREVAFCYMQAGPATRVIRVHILDELVRV